MRRRVALKADCSSAAVLESAAAARAQFKASSAIGVSSPALRRCSLADSSSRAWVFCCCSTHRSAGGPWAGGSPGQAKLEGAQLCICHARLSIFAYAPRVFYRLGADVLTIAAAAQGRRPALSLAALLRLRFTSAGYARRLRRYAF